jgi:membrane protein YdbS with pleckstrin-like domain
MTMSETHKPKIGEEFKPAPQLKTLYYIYVMLGILFGVLTWYIPVLLAISRVSDNAPFIVTLVSIPLLVILIFIAYWIPKYYETMQYQLTGNEIVRRRGVWFKQTGIVPYSRITNIDTTQGPISRMLGIAALKIQTAGYSGQQTRAEMRIEGMEHFEELRELIMEFVRGKKPAAVETYAQEEEDINLKMLTELVKIRELLEKASRK